MKKSVAEQGLTLVELLVVIVLIGLISTVVVRNVVQQGGVAKAEVNAIRMNQVKQALATYNLKYNGYPAKLDDLINGGSEVRNQGMVFMPLASPEDLKDVWGAPFIYRIDNDGRTYSLKSLGADGIEGGDGAAQDVTVRP